nr:ORF3 [Bracoviriform inaniti]
MEKIFIEIGLSIVISKFCNTLIFHKLIIHKTRYVVTKSITFITGAQYYQEVDYTIANSESHRVKIYQWKAVNCQP